VLQLGLIVTAFIGFTRKRYGLILGLAFFYISLLPSSRIIAEASTNQMPVLADRLLYLPSVGLSIALAFGLEWLSRRFSPQALVMTVLAITIIMTPVTWARNAEWASDVVLFESDYRKLKGKNVILMTLISAHIGEGSMKRAAEICDTHQDVLHKLTIVSTRCGFAYGHVGRYDDAEEAFFYGMKKGVSAVDAHFQLAIMYVHLNRKTDAEKHFELAVAAEDQVFMKHYRKASALIQLYPTYRPKLLEARDELEQAIELQPQHAVSRDALQALNERISIADRR